MSPDVILFDTNIPMYASGAAHEYRQPCAELMRRARRREIDAVTDAEVHQEIIHHYVSIGLPQKARDVSEDFEELVQTIFPVTRDEVRVARELVERYPRLPGRDLIHVAVMLTRGIDTILSADHHFDAVGEITRLDPIVAVSTNPA